jgi:membrane dipeptidase
MLSFLPFHLDPEKTDVWRLASGWHWFTHPREPETPLALLIDHIDHVVEVAGIDHVGLGSDFDNVPWAPEGLGDVSDYPNITTELLRRGYSDEDTHKILGGNVLRLLEEVEGVALSSRGPESELH